MDAKTLEKPARQRIMALQSTLSNMPGALMGDNDTMPLTHKFCEGMYVREIFIPAGHVVVGKLHKHAHPNFLMRGKVLVFTEQDGLVSLEAPLSMISSAGTKRVVYTLTDTVWVTVHRTDSQDLKEIEEEVIAKSYEEFERLVLQDNHQLEFSFMKGDLL